MAHWKIIVDALLAAFAVLAYLSAPSAPSRGESWNERDSRLTRTRGHAALIVFCVIIAAVIALW